MRRVAAVVLASALAAGGCGGARPTGVVSPSASQWDPSTMPDPCRLVSQPEVADAIARPPRERGHDSGRVAWFSIVR